MNETPGGSPCPPIPEKRGTRSYSAGRRQGCCKANITAAPVGSRVAEGPSVLVYAVAATLGAMTHLCLHRHAPIDENSDRLSENPGFGA